MTITLRDKLITVLFFLSCLVVLTRGLSIHGVEYRDDEIFYFQSTKEMLIDGNFLSPTYFGEDRFQKPILFYWLILLSYKILGINWFAARFVAVCFASFSVCGTYLLAREFFSRRVSCLSAVILMSLPLFLRHAKNAVPDMPLNFFIVAAIYCGIVYLKDASHKKYAVLFYVLSGLGFMIKGIAALVIPLGTILLYLFLTNRKEMLKQMMFLRGLFIWVVIIAPWFAYMALVHGKAYLGYMLVEETKERILGTEADILLIQGKRFLEHACFYLRTILSYFLPYSLIALFAIPITFFQRASDIKEGEGVKLSLIWIVLVFMIFSNMYFSISHYMLVLATPFSILVAYFLLDMFNESPKAQKIRDVCVSSLFLTALGIGLFAFSFLVVFLAGLSKWWFGVFLLIFMAALAFVIRRPDPIKLPLILSLFIIFVFSQSALMVKAGVTSHGVLQRFAKTVHEQSRASSVIGVGSPDIHEKEFQVYFDRKVVQAGHSRKDRTQQQLRQLFDQSDEVYCLLTQLDYNEYSSWLEVYKPQIIQQEFMIRKRMNLDRRFLFAFITLDQEIVRNYLMERIFLIKKDENARI